MIEAAVILTAISKLSELAKNLKDSGVQSQVYDATLPLQRILGDLLEERIQLVSERDKLKADLLRQEDALREHGNLRLERGLFKDSDGWPVCPACWYVHHDVRRLTTVSGVGSDTCPACKTCY